MDTSMLAFPKPKDKKKVKKDTKCIKNEKSTRKSRKSCSKKEEFCIMPKSNLYSTTRFNGSERHEVFEGRTGNRDKSIEDGLVIFLTPEMHRTSPKAIHKDYEFWNKVKEIAEKRWCKYYKKNKKDFKDRYGKNYL